MGWFSDRWWTWTVFGTIIGLLGIYFVYEYWIKTEPDLPPISFWGEQNYTDPSPDKSLVQILNGTLEIGNLIQIYGNTTKNATKFCVSLSLDEQTLPMQICALFGNVSLITYKAFTNRNLKANYTGPNPLTAGEALDLRIRVLDKYLQIFAAQGEVGIFPKVQEIHQATNLSISGDVTGMKLITVIGKKYPNPWLQEMEMFNMQRLDIIAQPLANFDSSTLWENLIEGRNGTSENNNLRVKRRGSHSSGRGGSHSRGGGSHSSSSHHSSFHSTGHSGGHYAYSYHYSSSHSHPSWSSSHHSHPGKTTWGTYFYSPTFGGYYILPSFKNPNVNNSHIYTPATYSYRSENQTLYSQSFNHNQWRNDSKIDSDKVPRPKRFDILFYGPENATAFTISFRFSEETVVLNHFKDGEWKAEQRNGFMPIDDWRIFDLTIINEPKVLHIYLNRYSFAFFEHIGSVTTNLQRIRIDGDIELFALW